MVKARDYEPGDSIEAASPYGVFFALRDSERPLEVGDMLEAENGNLRICKFVGFDEAQWIQPESRASDTPVDAESPVSALE